MNLMTLIPQKELSTRQDILKEIKDNDQVTVLSPDEIRKEAHVFIPTPFEILYELEYEVEELGKQHQFEELFTPEHKEVVARMTQNLNQLTVIKTTDDELVKHIKANGSGDCGQMITVYVNARPRYEYYLITMINDLNDYFKPIL